MSATYLDLGVVRVQRYVGRWPTLAGRRAASALLSRGLAFESLSTLIGQRAVPTAQAGQIDSVLSLELAAGIEPQALATELLVELRRRLPAAEFEASWAEADDYVSAYPAMRRRQASGNGLVSLPLACGFPLLSPCDGCKIDPAVLRRRVIDETLALCADCLRRAEQHPTSPAERRLAASTGLSTADDFESLANLGIDDKKNHLALVCADGNAFGQFFAALVASGQPKDQVSAALSAATWTALTEATVAVSAGTDGASRVLPHVVGGDDLVVSVPASFGWRFARAYLAAFNREVRIAVEHLGPGFPVPTASASIVIAKSTWPINAAVEVGEQLLRRAKEFGHGLESTIAWLDVTRRGPHAESAFEPLPLYDLDAWADHLAVLRQSVSSSAQHNLERALAEPDPRISDVLVVDTARRLGLADFVQPPISPLWDLGQALDISRWWFSE